MYNQETYNKVYTILIDNILNLEKLENGTSFKNEIIKNNVIAQ